VTPAGDFDYETGGAGYALRRRTDPRIAALIRAALGPATTVINVGAGAGSYEPEDLEVTAVEPSASMRLQRPAHLSVAIDAVAEDLPFDDDSFDAAMATVTIHQWSDHDRGLSEIRRVSRGPVVILTFDGDALDDFWLARFAPEMIEAERRRYPSIERVREVLGGESSVTVVPIAHDCVDGFTEAFYARPEAFLDDAVRRSQSAWSFVDDETEAASVEKLRTALESGAWDERFGALREQPQYLGSLRLIVATPSRHSTTIRLARLDEVAILTQLAFESKRYWGYDDEFMERCRSELVVRESDVATGLVFVATDGQGGVVTGLYVLKMVNSDEAELDMLFVDPSRIGDGVGALLLAHALETARASGCSVVRVESDPFAAAFYEHQGATLVGVSTSASTGRDLPLYEFRW
jgi:GNAT superfamily N-acetyltransferase/SAM-dependent methyltransferase